MMRNASKRYLRPKSQILKMHLNPMRPLPRETKLGKHSVLLRTPTPAQTPSTRGAREQRSISYCTTPRLL